MCGMVGYVGTRSALDVVLAGLERLERPGHDACGVAVLADGSLACARAGGRLPALRDELDRRPLPSGGSGVGHVRLAGHGTPGEGGAHPQLDAAGRVAVVHDGRIDNRAELRAELTARGHALTSGTDTEVLAHLLAEAFSSCGELGEAARLVCGSVRGAFALLAVHADEADTVVGACRDLPLAVGVGDGESFVASDAAAFAGEGAHEVLPLGGAGQRVVVLRREWDEVRCEVTDGDGGTVARA